MKTKFTLITAFFLITFSMIAQKPIFLDDTIVVGRSVCMARYTVAIVEDIDNPEKRSTDLLVLEMGESLSKCYNRNLYLYDSSYTKSEKLGRTSYPIARGVHFPEEVLKHFQESNLMVNHRMPDKIIYQYEERIPDWRWKLCEETCEILGYFCRKAQCAFRGRQWTAWYTEQISISDGPWKFCGLPGLILKVEDEKGHYSFTCESIQNDMGKPIVAYDKYYYTQATREQVYKELKEIYADWYAYLRFLNGGRLEVGKRDKNGKVTFVEVPLDVKKPIPYNPIELE